MSLSTTSSAEHLSQMVDALLLQQAAIPIAFDHEYITPFERVSSSRPNCTSTGILSNAQRRVTVSKLNVVGFLSTALFWHP